MATRLARLFEKKRFVRAYPTLRTELVAVRDRKKGIAFEVWPRNELDNVDYRELVEQAMELQLSVVHHPTSKRRDADIYVYVLHPDQMWRVQAHQVLRSDFLRFNGAWSDGAEAFESLVLGYNETQVEEWLATRRHERLGWGQQTVFALLDETQRATIARVRGRYLASTLFEGGLELFFATGEHVVRRDAHRLVESGQTLARMAVDWTWFRKQFGTDHGKRRIVTVELGPRDADKTNAALNERVQVLTDDGWIALAR